jgi:4-amino-4-deoxy-L-arabinose transferase-like glycosyltransferase
MAGILRGLSSLFQDTQPRARADRRVLGLFFLIVAVGVVVRFWGLGNVGLHGDEKTMALPAMHLLQHGTPEMPSGFLYPRAVAQLYLIAGSALAFGPSEWAFRLPSALCGVLLIVLTWIAGRRFLEPRWNLALTAVVALLPAFIQDAQTARMYVFLTTGVAGFMALLFAWERTGRRGYLIAAVVEIAVTLQFHTLAVFAAWLCFLPGLLSGERRKWRDGALAFIAIAAIFVVLNRWISSEYPHALGALDGTAVNGPRAVAPPLHLAWALAMALPAIALSWFVIRARGLVPVLLLAASLVTQVLRLDHVAVLLIVAALVVARRDGSLPAGRLAVYFAACVLLGAAQVWYLSAQHSGTLAQILGLLLGWPSVRTFLAISRYSVVALLLAIGGVGAGLWRLAHRERVPDHVLFLTLGVWIPLLQIGCFSWDPEQRYVEGQIMPLLVAAFAVAQWGFGAASELRPAPLPRGRLAGFGAAAAAVLCILVINPRRLEAAVAPTYAHYPDHKGAAEFVASLHPAPGDVIVAEDDLMQTYYLGHVDYWLQDRETAAPFLVRHDDKWVDVYTDTPLIGSGQQLERLVARRDRGAIYVIGSGENAEGRAALMRGLGIEHVLDSSAFHLIYVGRDRLTDVWKVDAPGHPLTAAAHAARRG